MKKLLGNVPMLHFTVVLTIIAVACGLVIGGVNAITAPIIAENERLATLASYEEVMPGLADFETLDMSTDASSIEDKVKATDSSGDVIGYIYKASGTNGYGDMTIVISIDPQGVIIGAQYLTLNQTLYLDRTRANLQLFVGTNISDLTPSGDLQGGATYSKTTTLNLLSDIADSFAVLPIEDVYDPYEEMFGEGYTLTVDSTFTTIGVVLSRQIATDTDNNEVGYLYELEGSGIYNSDDSTEKSIKLYVGLDLSNNILGIYVPEDDYHHSGGSLMNNTISYLETLVGTNIGSFDSSADLTSGATNSKTLANELLDALKGVVIPEWKNKIYS